MTIGVGLLEALSFSSPSSSLLPNRPEDGQPFLIEPIAAFFFLPRRCQLGWAEPLGRGPFRRLAVAGDSPLLFFLSSPIGNLLGAVTVHRKAVAFFFFFSFFFFLLTAGDETWFRSI